LVDGDPYADDTFIDRLREYHAAAARAHREHNQPDVPLPVATPAYAIGYSAGDLYGTNGNGNGTGTGSYLDGTYGGNGTGNGTGNENGAGGDDVIDFGGSGSGSGSGSADGS
jgi:hypothetical protein